MWSLSECTPWMTVGLTHSVAIVTLNFCTIIVFTRNRNLRKRSTYLVVNLAVKDMLVGGVAVYYLFYWSGMACNLWKWQSAEDGVYISIEVLMVIFLFGSLINIAIIALERVHATFYPFRHRVLKKCVYRLIIAVVWVTSGLLTVSYILLRVFELYYFVYLYVTIISTCLLIVCVSYTSIVIKVRCGAQPQHHGAASREKRLTMTLLIVTVVSLVLYVPHVLYRSLHYFRKFEIWRSLSPSVYFHLDSALLALSYANSLANPILYAIRMPEYRSALRALFRRGPQQQRQVANFPLRDMLCR